MGSIPIARSRSFGAALAKVREERGFPTAHAFFGRRGGRKALGLSYPNYLNLEQGKSLPKAWRLLRILAALGLEKHSRQARELVRAYLTSALGSDELLGYLDPGGTAASPTRPRSLAEEAAHQALRERTVQLSLDQFRVLAARAENYACHLALVNTPGWQGKADLAAMAGLPPAKAAQAVQELEKAGLAEVSGSRARTPFPRKHLAPPAPTPALSGIFAALQRYRERFIRRRGGLRHLAYLTVRMSQERLGAFLPHLDEVVRLSAVYGEAEKAEDTAVFLVEGRVYRLFQ